MAAGGRGGTAWCDSAGAPWLAGAAVTGAHAVSAKALGGLRGALYEDGGDMHALAVRLSHELAYGPPEAFRPPGWPLVLAGCYRVFGADPQVGLALNAVLAGLAVVALIGLGRRLGLTGPQAILAGLSYGLFPGVLVISGSLYSESLFNLLIIVLCLLIVEFRDRRPTAWWWLVAGVVAAYATLVRPVLMFWLPACLLFALGRRFDWRAVLGVVAGLAIVLGPWTWRNYERLDAFVPLSTAGGLTLALANNDLAGAGQSQAGLPPTPYGEVRTDRELRHFAVEWIRDNPGEFAKRVPQRIARTFDPMTRTNKDVFAPPPVRWLARVLWAGVLVLAAIGIVRRHRGSWLVPLSFVVLLIMPVTFFGGGFRFLIPALPFLALWAVVGTAGLLRSRAVRVGGGAG